MKSLFVRKVLLRVKDSIRKTVDLDDAPPVAGMNQTENIVSPKWFEALGANSCRFLQPSKKKDTKE